MTEAEWLACEDPLAMYRGIGHELPRAGRKSMLFGCACCYHIWDHLLFPAGRDGVVVAERFADGAASEAELLAAERAARAIPDAAFFEAVGAVIRLCNRQGAGVARAAARAGFGRPAPGAREERLARFARFLRDIFGNPFRPVTFSPDWRTDTATAIAKQMYESRDFSAMPILADALQDAGCDNTDILNHCRAAGGGTGEPAGGSSVGGESLHVRGCWVVDLVLDKA